MTQRGVSCAHFLLLAALIGMGACKNRIQGTAGEPKPVGPGPVDTQPRAPATGGETTTKPTNNGAASTVPPLGDEESAKRQTCTYDAKLGTELARIAEKATHGNMRPRGLCWKFVDDDIEAYMRTHGRGSPSKYGVRWPTMAAYEWADSAIPRKLQVSQGMMLRYAPEHAGKNPTALPLGAVIIYKPGKCGFNQTYGHVEVKISNNRFASDYIQIGRTCAPDYVFMPSSDCK